MPGVTDKVRILGIDPGLAKCGYAVIEYDGRSPTSLEFGLIRTDAGGSTPSRLNEIVGQLINIIDEFSPDELAIERVYFHRNVSTAIDVAMVMGAAMVLAMSRGIACRQYAPKQIKRAIVGTGGANKLQVQKMVEKLYGLGEIPKPPDAADALAVALTHAHLRGAPEEMSVG